MTAVGQQSGRVHNVRRSQRVCVSVDVVVVGEGPDKKPVSEATRTLIVNAHGALILLDTKVAIGQLLTLKNLSTQEGLSCRVVGLGSSESGRAEVGIEFIEPAPRFWRIAFPPVDWTPRSPEAKGRAPQVAVPQNAEQKK